MIDQHEKNEILKNYMLVKDEIHQTGVVLVVISKFQPIEKIRVLLEQGHRHFGESRIQEINDKWNGLRDEYPDIVMHFIGAIQSRKVKQVVANADYIHSLDRLDIAEKINHEAKLLNKTMKCFIQVNVGQERQKSGILESDFYEFIKACQQFSHLSIEGAMCIPPNGLNPEIYFNAMKNIQLIHSLKELSMGMSNDYTKAIACGSTMMRVGSKILGTRHA